MQNTLVGPREHWDELRSAFREFFKTPDDQLFEEVRDDLTVLTLRAGDVLVREDERSEELFFVVSGRLRAVRRHGQMKQVLGEVVRGETVGELGLITGEPRSATVLAVRDSLVARMNRPTFERILAGGPKFSIAVMRSIIDRFRRGDGTRRAGRVTLCLAPITPGLDLASFAQRLSDRIAGFGGSVRLLTHKDFDILSDEDRANASDPHGGVARWLDLTEVASSALIMLADPEPSDWTRMCLRRADEILLVADADSEAIVCETESRLLDEESVAVRPMQTLVLLHPADKRSPTGTAAWLNRRSVARHLHIRPTLERDISRLARLVTGRGIGIVLSGGGARGFAHVGAINALDEAGFCIDVVGGTSIGSAIGALRAMELRGEALVSAVRRLFVERGSPTSDYNLFPLVSLMKGTRTRRITEEAVRDAAGQDIGIEDTWITCFSVAGNYSTSTEAILTRGSLAKALLASSAIPGAMPPIIIDGYLYVDGGTVNNLPVDVVQRYGVGRTVAVDLVSENVRKVDVDAVPGPFALLLDRLFHSRGKRVYNLPSLPEMLLNASALQSTVRQREMGLRADLRIQPRLKKVRLLDWHRFDEIVKAGFDSAVEDLAVTDPTELTAYR